MTKNIFPALFLALLATFPAVGQKKSNIDYVNPMIGAFGPAGSKLAGKDCGRTFPGATTPFSSVPIRTQVAITGMAIRGLTTRSKGLVLPI